MRQREGHFQGGPGKMRVGALILAAGSSSRMGRPKQTLQFQGESLIRRAALAALGAGCHPVVVVTGANAELIRSQLDGLDVCEVLNTLWETGMASSIRVGFKGLVGADTDAAVVMLCDQPHHKAVGPRMFSSSVILQKSQAAAGKIESCGTGCAAVEVAQRKSTESVI